MPVSVLIADVGAAAGVRALTRKPKPARHPGLLHAEVALAKPLGGGRVPKVQPGRVCLLTYWEEGADIDGFEATDPLARSLAGGFHARLDPLRRFGTWPGIPDDLTVRRSVDHEGCAVVITLARTKFSQLPRFLPISAGVEQGALAADGLLWGTAMATPPFIATCTVWESTEALSAYAYGAKDAVHPLAMVEDRRKPFHHQAAFVRFRPTAIGGRLAGRNPLTSDLAG